jgi:signal transduction histidine kinase
LERETFDLAELVAELAQRYREEAERRGSEMHVDTPPGAVGSWDRNRLEQVITNLLSNAIKYGNAHPIHIEVRHDATTALVVVRDEGIGIPAEALGTIFQRFERVAPTHGYGGLGLGLYIAKQIAEAHGGTIEVESELGKGSRFSLILQREPAPLSADERQVQGAHQR